MKFHVTFKDPDALDYAIQDATAENPDVDDEKLRKVASSFFDYGEYVTIEIDTDKKTATVVK